MDIGECKCYLSELHILSFNFAATATLETDRFNIDEVLPSLEEDVGFLG